MATSCRWHFKIHVRHCLKFFKRSCFAVTVWRRILDESEEKKERKQVKGPRVGLLWACWKKNRWIATKLSQANERYSQDPVTVCPTSWPGSERLRKRPKLRGVFEISDSCKVDRVLGFPQKTFRLGWWEIRHLVIIYYQCNKHTNSLRFFAPLTAMCSMHGCSDSLDYFRKWVFLARGPLPWSAVV